MIYNLVIYIYLFGVKVAGLFSAKPAKMVKGHREVFDILRNKIDKKRPLHLVSCSFIG